MTIVRVDGRAAARLRLPTGDPVVLAPASLRLHLLLQALAQPMAEDLPASVHDKLEVGILRWLELCRLRGVLRPITDATSRSSRMAVDKARVLMGRSFAEPLAVAQIAAHCRYSQYYFSRIFRELTGYPVYGFLKRTRVAAAVIRLLTTRERIGRIAKATGFASHSHLTAVFSRIYGVAPAEVRHIVADRDPERLTQVIGLP